MKNAPRKAAKGWYIDETRCLKAVEVRALRVASIEAKRHGLQGCRFTSVRNWFMVELGLHTGLRVEEMAGLRHGDLFLNNGRSSLHVVGKGNKPRSVWIGSRFRKLSEEYIRLKVQFGYSVDNQSFLLNNRQGNRITKRSLQKFFSRMIADTLGPGSYSIHTLRHTYATFLLQATGNNYRFAQKQLGHASIRTTQVYAGVIETEARAGLEKMYK